MNKLIERVDDNGVHWISIAQGSGDLITACSDLDSLEISVSYEDEAVRCSCN